MSIFGDQFKVENYIKSNDSLNKNSFIETGDYEGTNYDYIDYTPVDVENAIEWSKQTGYPIIYPTRNIAELENLWDNWNSYHLKVRMDSDDASMEYFGVDNTTHYKYLKSGFLKDDIKVDVIGESSYFIGDIITSHRAFAENNDIDTSTRAEDLLSLLNRKNEAYEDIIIKDMVDKSTSNYIASNQNIRYDVIPFEDLPFFTPDEMIDFGVNNANPEDNFYGCEPIANVISEDTDEWFTSYCNACVGFGYDYNPIKWKDSVSKLFLKMNIADNKDPYKQAILNLGWPPEAEFSPENRVKAKKRVKELLNTGSTQFVDLTGMDAEDFTEAAVVELKEDEALYPVFIVLHEGKTVMSAAIKKVTNSLYSHASISFDPEMKTMYSYGIEGSEKGLIGGFIEEHIKDKDPDRHMAIFTIFLKKQDWDKLKSIIEDFVKNVGKTSYSYINLLVSHIFKIPMNMNKKMVCSQFVDRVLKLIDIDISKKNSSLVSPADFERFAKENKKIYILFDDFVYKFNPRRIKNLIKRLSFKAEPIKESSINIIEDMITNIRSLSGLQELYYDIDKMDKYTKKIYDVMIAPCLEAECYLEAKDIPVQFDKDGNLFIKNIKKRDYEGEYSKSHKLLRKYEETGNIEGMKYELCKLWMMNSVIESNLNSKKFKKLPSYAIESSKEHKARAKILNDFNYFLGVVLKEEADFNFEEYFNNSPFSDAMIKINKDTIIWSGRLLKMLIKNL